MSLRRLRIRAVALLGVLATLGIIGWYGLIAEPLVYGGSGFITSGDQVTDPSAPGATRYVFHFVPSGPITWGLSIRNTLLVPVTIRGLHTGSAGAALVTDEALHLDPDGSVPPEQLKAFAPIELAPGQATFLAVTARFADCASAQRNWSPGSALVQDELPLDVTVLGIPRVARVGLSYWGVAYDAPGEGTCTAATVTVPTFVTRRAPPA